MTAALADRVESILGVRPAAARPLAGGCVGEVVRLDMPGGDRLVAKVGAAGSGLEVEGHMLGLLDDRGLPVPDVLHADDTLLLMEFIDNDGRLDDSVEVHAAELLADLHDQGAPAFGLDRDTRIGGLPQPNGAAESWLEFFRDRRLMHMGAEALAAGRLPAAVFGRLERLCARLDRWIVEPAAPELLHGDLWTGNVLCRAGRVAAFIDPAVYYGHAETDLAFSTLFGTFGRPFFLRYQELRGVRPGFFEERRELYNLYPLLVHVRLFGGDYVAEVEATLARHGV